MLITINKSNQLKSLAILMMLCLHLFNRDYKGLFSPLFFIANQPLTYYISLFCDACVPIFAFVSGLGLYYKYKENKTFYNIGNIKRLKKLYINYWIILIVFAVLLGWLLQKNGYPGSISKFLLNFIAIDNSYNGAWWFLTIYVLFVLTSAFWFNILDKINPYFFFITLLVLYLIAFYFRIYKTDIFDNPVLHWLHKYLALYCCTLFQFILGAMALKYNWAEKVASLFKKIHFNNTIGIVLIFLLIVFHALVPNFIVAPFTALAFIMIFVNLHIPQWLDKGFKFLNPHATNMWLIHMFYYLIFFPVFIYSFKYPIAIFLVLVGLCIMSSFIINKINTTVQKWL